MSELSTFQRHKARADAIFADPAHKVRVDAAVAFVEANPDDDGEQALCDADTERHIEAAAAREQQAAIQEAVAAAKWSATWHMAQRRLDARKAISTPEQLEQHVLQQKPLDEKAAAKDKANRHIAEVKRVAASTFAPNSMERELLRQGEENRDRELQRRQQELFPGSVKNNEPLLLMPLSLLMQQIENNFAAEDNSTRLANSNMLAVAERRFNTGEAGNEYVDFRHYCSHLLPNREWRDIRKLLAHGRTHNPAASLVKERAKNKKSAKKYYERKKHEKVQLETKVAQQARQIAAQQAEIAALTAASDPSETRFDIRPTDLSALPRSDIRPGSTTQAPTQTDPYDELFDVTDRISRQVEHDRERITREWPALVRRRILERFHRGFGYDEFEIPIRDRRR